MKHAFIPFYIPSNFLGMKQKQRLTRIKVMPIMPAHEGNISKSGSVTDFKTFMIESSISLPCLMFGKSFKNFQNYHFFQLSPLLLDNYQ